ncbi:YprB ribonuclease H-like domain-containing protein [Sphingomonas antarctica]|uniref:hypothetical protein n=1 Tax=Sphingomonas antarctica TaxID=2040274 RepID=UPI0039EAA666
MTDKPKTWVAMTAATVAVPASRCGNHPPDRCLVGIGLFIAEHGATGRWHFERYAHALIAGEREDGLLEAIADRLPPFATLIGWNVDQVLVPLLLETAAVVPPTIEHHFSARLYRLLSGGVVDMALCHGGMGAPPLATVARTTAIDAPDMDADGIASAWASGEVRQLHADLADEALALWRIFVRAAGSPGVEVDVATDAWLERRKSLRLIEQTGGEGR